jgi:hypothetical protein
VAAVLLSCPCRQRDSQPNVWPARACHEASSKNQTHPDVQNAVVVERVSMAGLAAQELMEWQVSSDVVASMALLAQKECWMSKQSWQHQLE